MHIEQSNQQLLEQSLVFIDLPAFGYVMFTAQQQYSYEIFGVFTILYLLSYVVQYHAQTNTYGKYQIIFSYVIKIILIWLCSLQTNNWIYLVTFILQVRQQPISEHIKQSLWLFSGLLNIFNCQSAISITFIEILSFAQLSFCIFVYTQIQHEVHTETSRERTSEQKLQSSYNNGRSRLQIEPQQPWEKIIWLKHQEYIILNEDFHVIDSKIDTDLEIDQLFDTKFQIDTCTPTIAYFQDFKTSTIKELLQEFKEFQQQTSIFISGKCDKVDFQVNIFYAQDCFELNIIIHLIPIKQSEVNNNYLLRDICHSVSHELGTNLNCISTLASVYAEMNSIHQSIRKDILQPISTNCEQLNLIISNIRDYGSLETDQFQLKIGEFSLNQEINNILKFYTQTLKEKQIELNFKNQYQEVEVVSDRDRFRQVFYQLISNSVRYTSKGTVTITTSIESNIASVIVEDTGIGMNKQEQANLKNLLSQHLLLKVSQNSIGAGLGLFVSNMIVRKLNNDDKLFLEFQSEEKKGSYFKFTLRSHVETLKGMNKVSQGTNKSVMVLPEIGSYYEKKFKTFQTQIQRSFNNLQPRLSQQVLSKEISQMSDEKQDSSSNRLSAMNVLQVNTPKFEFNLQQSIQAPTIKSKCCAKVLIVDDEYFNILALNTLLLKYHTISDSAYNGVEAITRVLDKSKSPCKSCCNDGYYIIFLDINMPVKGGLETVVELKQMMKEERIPQSHCIANTAFCDLKTRMDSYAAGMDYFLTKPLSIANINEIFDELFPQL